MLAALTVSVDGMEADWGRAAGRQEERGRCLVEEERADAELEEEKRARGRRWGGRGVEEGVPGCWGCEVLRERGVRRIVAQPLAPRAARLQPPSELVATPVLAQQLSGGRRHPCGDWVACSGRSARRDLSRQRRSRWVLLVRNLDAGQPEKEGAGRGRLAAPPSGLSVPKFQPTRSS